MPSYLTQEFSYGFETSQNYNQENGVHLIAFCLPFVTFSFGLNSFGATINTHTQLWCEGWISIERNNSDLKCVYWAGGIEWSLSNLERR